MSGSQLASNVQEGDVWSGLLKADDIPQGLRVKGIDELGKLSYIFRGPAKFMGTMSILYPKPSIVSDREYKTIEISEYDRTFIVRGASDISTNHSVISFSNDQASQLEINDTLILTKTLTVPIYTDLALGQVEPNGGANIGPDLRDDYSVRVTNIAFSRNKGNDVVNNRYFYEYETVLITDKGQTDSGGPGLTTVTLRRCFHGGGAKDKGGRIIPISVVNAAIAADPDEAAIRENDVILRMLPSWTEGSSYPNGFYKSPVVDNNFTQQFKFGFTVTDESKIAKSFVSEGPIEIKRKLHAKRMMLDIERTMLFGRKGRDKDFEGKERYQMGGVVEFIPKDEEHIITHNAPDISYSSMLDVGERVFSLGGSQERYAFMSYKLHARIKKSFAEHPAFRFNMDESKKFDFVVETLYTTGGAIHLMPLHTMEESGFSNDMLVLDLSVPAFTPVTHKGYDMKVEKDIGDRGTSIYKEGVTGMKGLRRRFAQYQSIVQFI